MSICVDTYDTHIALKFKTAVGSTRGQTLERAMEELASLPDADQKRIGLSLLLHVEKLRLLRDDIDKGLRALDDGEGKPLDIEKFIRRANGSRARDVTAGS